ncbi:MAG: hypothetical protein HN831_02045 [Waddliaceae bacterium]|jgi:hypothetical protein|nr:hypothetical protein [Waddliaceae bacterium]
MRHVKNIILCFAIICATLVGVVVAGFVITTAIPIAMEGIISYKVHTPKSEYSADYKKMMGQFTQDMCKKYNFSNPEFSGMFFDTVEELTCNFNSKKKLTPEEARIISVNCAKEMLSRINSNENIKPYLKSFPFTANNISLFIVFTTPDGKGHYGKEFVSHVHVSRNSIYYSYYDDTNTKTRTYRTLKIESYSEALKIVKGE